MKSLTPKDINLIYTQCVCKIFTFSNNIPISQGSGIFLKSNNIIITNYHIFIGADNFKVILSGNEVPKCKIVSINAQNDLLLIYVNSLKYNISEIKINKESYVGEKVYAFGFPLNYKLTMTEGIISNLNADIKIKLEENYFTNEINQSGVMQISAPISHGSSGGALVNDKGELIGITTYSDKSGIGINFAIPAKEVLSEINEFDKLKIDKLDSKKLNAVDYYCLGINLMENADFKSAYKLLKKSIKVLRNNTNILFNLAILCNIIGNFGNALKYCDKLIKIEGMSLRAIRCKASLFLSLEKKKEALKMLNIGIKLYPANQYLYYTKAQAYFDMKKYHLSLKEVDKAVELGKENYDHIKFKAKILEQLNDLNGAISQYEYLLINNPNDIDINFKLADLNSVLGYDRKSLEFLNNLVKVDEKNYIHFFNRSRAYYLLEDYYSAIEDLLVSIKLNPKDAISYYNMALCYAAFDNQQECINYYTKCINLDPDNVDAINNRGMEFMNLENYVSALNDFKAVLKKSPDYDKSINNVAICYQKNKEFTKAQVYFDKIIKQKNPNPSYYVNRALNFYVMGKTKKAMADFAKAEKMDPENSILYTKRTRILMELGLLKEALLDAEKLIKISPNDINGYIQKARILLEQKKFRESQKFVDKAICLRPEIGETYFLRGEIYTALGKYEQAMIEYNYSIRLDNRNPDSYVAYGKVCKKTGYHNLANLNFEQACILDSTYFEKVNKLMNS
ncbi:MAG TPA: trypsin-like peptidase domain-containing protein [Ignavibacteria bacterium]